MYKERWLIMRHDGVRPVHTLVLEESKRKRKVWIEEFPDGSRKFWNARLLNSGCGKYLTDPEVEGTLVYCNYCREWFDIKQFKE